MRSITMILFAIFLAACNQQSSEHHESPAAEQAGEPATGTTSEPDSSLYLAAVANEARPEADRARDAGRKPAKVLEFLGIRQNMHVLDMFSGGGYYTEIIASVVGDGGSVVAHSNEAYLQFVGDEFHDRYANDRLANASVLMAENNELSLEPESFDAIMLVLSFHDLYYEAPDRGWPKIEVGPFLAELYEGVKPGGIVGVVDHYAAAGASSETGNTVHRIDPAIVIAEMQAAGFELDAQSDLLRNPDDDHSKLVFDPEVRGKTDRFVMRFKKS